ncbi:MAG: hypothetical protein GY856_16755 [bacterium]|nr:hypothetical protein [bacterium]
MIELIAGVWLCSLALGAAAEGRARRRLAAVPHRILVGGARGKTTLVRLIHAGLSAAGLKTEGRISGDRPAVIGADGGERGERRWGPANIRELRRFLNRIPKLTEAVVVENMAIDPQLQRLVASHLVRPTLAVMAPDAPDHLEVQPIDPEMRARVLLSTLPPAIPLILPHGECRSAYERAAERLGRGWTAAPACDAPELRRFMTVLAGLAIELLNQISAPIGEAPVNAVLAAAVRLQKVRVFRRERVAWIDAFSANDPLAAADLEAVVAGEAEERGYTAVARLFNHRADRPSRLALFAGQLARPGPAWVVGAGFPRSWRPRLGAARLTGKPAAVVAAIEAIMAAEADRAYVLCLGNAGGTGSELRRWLAAHAEAESW